MYTDLNYSYTMYVYIARVHKVHYTFTTIRHGVSAWCIKSTNSTICAQFKHTVIKVCSQMYTVHTLIVHSVYTTKHTTWCIQCMNLTLCIHHTVHCTVYTLYLYITHTLCTWNFLCFVTKTKSENSQFSWKVGYSTFSPSFSSLLLPILIS